MSKEIEDKLVKIPVLNILVRFGKKIKIPGLEGMSFYDVLEMYIIGIVEGALTTRAGGIAYSFFMAIFPFMLFVLTLIPYIHIDGFQEGLMTLISEVLPPKTFDAVDTVLLDILGNKQAGLLSFGFIGSIFLFVLTLIPYIHIDGFQEGLMTLISEVLPPKTFDAVDTVLLYIL